MNRKDTLWFAMRFLGSRKQNSPFSFVSRVSIAGLAIGVAALTVTLAILSGFDREYKARLLSLSSHAVVLGSGEVHHPEPIEAALAQVPGVIGVQPFVMGEGMLTHQGKIAGTVMKGIDPAKSAAVIDLQPILDPPQPLVKALESGDVPSVILGKTLSERLGVRAGERLQFIVLREGKPPEMYPLQVTAIFSSGMHEYDHRFAFLRLDVAQRLFLKKDGVTGLEIAVAHPEKIEDLVVALKAQIPGPYFLLQWKELNANLFAALKLEKVVFFLVILPIVAVGALTVVASLIMFMMERRRGIAILRTIGFGKGIIAKVFFVQGVAIAVIGTGVGLGFGTCINLILAHSSLIRLSPQIYFIDHLPISMQPGDYGLIILTTFAICALATLIPAIQASRLSPVEGIRGR